MKHIFQQRVLYSLLMIFLLVSCGSETTLSGGGSGGDDTFDVTTQSKTNAHPAFGQGSPTGMLIDSVEGEQLTLTRGESYTFIANTPASHPLYLTDSSTGAGLGTSYAGGPNAHSGASFVFTPNASTPNLIYYQCTNHQQMGWQINVVDP